MARAMAMSEESTLEYTEKMRGRYGRLTGKQARSRLIDEYVAVTGFERKYAIKVLRGTRRRGGGGRRGARKRYGEEVDEALKRLWLAMDQPCGKRMKDMLPLWLDHGEDSAGLREQLLGMGAATIDRHLARFKVGGPKKRLPPRSDAAIKAQKTG